MLYRQDPQSSDQNHPQRAEFMRRARILAGGLVALILFAVVCIPRHLPSQPLAAAITPASLYISFQQNSLVFRGSLPSERSKTAILQQAHTLYAKKGIRVTDQFTVDPQVGAATWVDTIPQLLPILGWMVERGSIIIDGHSLVLTGQVSSPREKADVLHAIAPAVRAGLTIEDRVMVAPTTTSPPTSVSLSALQLSLNQVLAKSSIEFEPDSATITAKGHAVLDHIVVLLQKVPTAPIEIASHTDIGGAAEHNLQLSRHRADAVKQYLTRQGLTNPFTTIGYGSTRPLSNRKYQPGLPQNQRIELLMIRTT
ncbi:MAG: OmpA family protein [Nitrospira sp.]|nr:OmpA family protein [Nitrospira sp.]